MFYFQFSRGINAFGSISCMLIVKRIWTCHMEFALYNLIIISHIISEWFADQKNCVARIPVIYAALASWRFTGDFGTKHGWLSTKTRLLREWKPTLGVIWSYGIQWPYWALFECKNQGHYAVFGTYDRGFDSNISTLCRTIAASTNNRRISELWVYENLYLSGYRKRQDLSIVNIMWWKAGPRTIDVGIWTATRAKNTYRIHMRLRQVIKVACKSFYLMFFSDINLIRLDAILKPYFAHA